MQVVSELSIEISLKNLDEFYLIISFYVPKYYV